MKQQNNPLELIPIKRNLLIGNSRYDCYNIGDFRLDKLNLLRSN